MVAHPDLNRPVAAGRALVHHAVRQNPVQFKQILVTDQLLLGVLFHIAQAREIVQHLAARSQVRSGEFAAFLQSPYVLQRQRIAFDGGGGMAVTSTRVLLQRGNPGKLNRRTQNPLPQGRDQLHQREQARTDRKLWCVGHGGKSSVSQAMSQAAKVLR